MASTSDDSLNSSMIGTFLVQRYRSLPFASILLKLAVRKEGGQIYSKTLRSILQKYYGVEVGPYAYGSLLEPGRADPQTVIEPYASIGPNVRRFGAAHPLSAPSLHPFWYNPSLGYVDSDADVERGKCTIGADSWIGANVTILPGCKRIGIGAVVGAGSVVTKDVPDFSIVVGNPAKQIAERLTEEQQKRLKDKAVWNLKPRELRKFLKEISEK